MASHKNILLVEDIPESAEIIRRILERGGYSVAVASDGMEAQQAFDPDQHGIVVTDLVMPRRGGEELIDWLKQSERPPQIIVLTGRDEIETVISVMRRGILDYSIKPVQADELIAKVDRASELVRLHQMEQTVTAERQVRLERQLEWTLWKQNIQLRDIDRSNRNLFQSLHSSLSQGAGFGIILSLLSMIADTARKTDEGYVIDEGTMELLQENIVYAQRLLDQFLKLNQIITTSYALEPWSGAQLHAAMGPWIDALSEKQKFKGQEIILSQLSERLRGVTINVEPDLLHEALEEILLNALKFSREETQIFVLLRSDSERLHLSVMNVPTVAASQKEPGVPEVYEQLVFEPFFRLHTSVDERFETLDAGLGLTRVQKIIGQLDGQIMIYNVRDHVDQGTRTNVEISLPGVNAG